MANDQRPTTGERTPAQAELTSLLQRCRLGFRAQAIRFVDRLPYGELSRARWAYACALAWQFRRQQPKLETLVLRELEADPHLLDGMLLSVDLQQIAHSIQSHKAEVRA